MRTFTTSIFQRSLALSLSIITFSSAQNINWGTGHSYSDTNYISYTSDGTPDTGSITWTLGFFSDSFIPTEENAAEWANYWVTLDTTSNVNVSGKKWGVSSNFSVLGELRTGASSLLGSYVVDAGSETGLEAGDFIDASYNTVWVFAYNDLDKMDTSEGEALLYSYNTTYPNSRTAISADLSLTNGLEIDIVWGRIDRDYLNLGGFEIGGGYFSNPIPEGVGQINGGEITGSTFEAQLGSWNDNTSYESFTEAVSQTTYTSSDLLPSADPDNRGLSNALSYALGLPLSGTLDKFQRSRIPKAVGSTDDTSMGMKFNIPAAPPEDVTYCIMESQDLTSDTWVEIARKTGASTWSGQADVAETPNAETAEIFVEPTEADATRSFMRLDVIIAE